MVALSLKDKFVLITGGSSGIGLDLAGLFLKEKANVILTASNPEKLKTAAGQLQKEFGREVLWLAKDLSDPASCTQIFDELFSRSIEVDILVNNAGFGLYGKFETLDLDRCLRMVEVNAKAVIHLTRLFLPAMLKKK